MNWLRRALGLDDGHDALQDEAKTVEVEKALHTSHVAQDRAARVVADYRRADDARARAGVRSRAAGEKLIDEIEDG